MRVQGMDFVSLILILNIVVLTMVTLLIKQLSYKLTTFENKLNTTTNILLHDLKDTTLNTYNLCQDVNKTLSNFDTKLTTIYNCVRKCCDRGGEDLSV